MPPLLLRLALLLLFSCPATRTQATATPPASATLLPSSTSPSPPAASASSVGTCIINPDGSFAAAGQCDGPVQRATVRFTNLTVTNAGCGPSQLVAYRDGNASDPFCAQCQPGTAGVEDSTMACAVNEFCDDSGLCLHAQLSPLYGQPCPWEQGGPTRYGWCGPALRCIAHVCRICLEASTDPSDGKVCVRGQWTYSAWDALIYNPAAIFQLCTFLLLCLYFLFLVLRMAPCTLLVLHSLAQGLTPLWPWLLRLLRKAWKRLGTLGEHLPRCGRAERPPSRLRAPLAAPAPPPPPRSADDLEIEQYLRRQHAAPAEL